MFTGLIEAVGEIAEITAIPSGFRVRIQTDLANELQPGESVAVNGVCLTAVSAERRSWSAEVGPETAQVTSLGDLRRGSRVNLERAMRADGRLGGHLVLGHVDGTGAVQEIRPESDFTWMTISYPAGLAPLMIVKGSVAVDGVSLTIARLSAASFDVQIVPFTLRHTNLYDSAAGDRVNLECDIIGKYVLRAMEVRTLAGRAIGQAERPT